jgi:hypothetical protein
MPQYLHRVSDGEPVYYVDEDGGPDPMLYTLDAQWVGYISSDGTAVYGPNREFLFSISKGYFCDASGAAVLYCDEEGADESALPELGAPLRLTAAQLAIVDKFAAPLHLHVRQAFSQRVIELLGDEREPDDVDVHRACERVGQEFQLPPQE